MTSPLLPSAARVFSVLLARKPSVDVALAALAKKAARKGLPVLSWSWGKPASAAELLSEDEAMLVPGAMIHATSSSGPPTYTAQVVRCSLTLDGGVVKLAGWSFVAALQHLDGENLVRTLPGETLPAVYRTAAPTCNHCQMIRRRKDTFVLRHDDGRVVQVGSTCLADFLGSDEAGKIAAQAEILAIAGAIADDGEGFGECSSPASELSLAAFLPVVAWAVERGWISRTKAREMGGFATADYAWTLLTNAKAAKEANVQISEDHQATALAAAVWAEELTDAAVDAESGDYLHNLRVIARSGLVSSRSAGLAASMIVAYQRAVSRAREQAARAARPTLDAFLGTVGDKVTFGLPAKVGKRGQALKHAPIVLSAAPVTLDFVTGYETQFGYVTLLKFRTAEGATLVWKTTSDIDLNRECVGKTYALAGSIKSHDEYKGAKQTTLARCVLTAVAVSGERAA